MSPRWHVRFAWALLAVSLVAWPVSAVTVAKDEPLTILSLSWLALVLTAWDIVRTADVRRSQDDE